MGLTVVTDAPALGVYQLYGVVNLRIAGTFRVAIQNGNPRRLSDGRHLPGRVTVTGLGQRKRSGRADVVTGQEHFRADQQVCPLCCGFRRPLRQAMQVAADIQRQRRALIQGDAHVRVFLSVSERDRSDFVEHIAWARVLWIGTAAKVIHDAPHRIQ